MVGDTKPDVTNGRGVEERSSWARGGRGDARVPEPAEDRVCVKATHNLNEGTVALQAGGEEQAIAEVAARPGEERVRREPQVDGVLRVPPDLGLSRKG